MICLEKENNFWRIVIERNSTQSVKLARTIADLAGNEEIQSAHVAETLQYRPKRMMGCINVPLMHPIFESV
jgi:predicted ATPase with chaperone activity